MTTRNICFHEEIRKLICGYSFFSGAMATCMLDLTIAWNQIICVLDLLTELSLILLSPYYNWNNDS